MAIDVLRRTQSHAWIRSRCGQISILTMELSTQRTFWHTTKLLGPGFAYPLPGKF
jgi:hypothetical protein